MKLRRLFGCVTAWTGALAWASSSCSVSSSDATIDGGARSDGGDSEGPLEAAAPAQDAVGDAGCHPGTTAGFVPDPSFPAIAFAPTACDGFGGDGGLVQAYGDACLSDLATYTTCAAFSTPDAAGADACHACLIAPPSHLPVYGVAVIATVPVVNYSACIPALDPSDAGRACALAVGAYWSCLQYACKSCPVTDEPSRQAFETCANTAGTGACLDYSLPTQSCVAAEQGDGGTPVATVCFGGATAEDHFLSAAHYFCGGG